MYRIFLQICFPCFHLILLVDPFLSVSHAADYFDSHIKRNKSKIHMLKELYEHYWGCKMCKKEVCCNRFLRGQICYKNGKQSKE